MKYFMVRRYCEDSDLFVITIYYAETEGDIPMNLNDDDDVEELELGCGDPNDPYIYRGIEGN